jgi:alkylation response protein AidB-like acyl-CoA dehydrogenase
MGAITSVLGRGVDSPEALAEARAWQEKAAADGWAGIGWPREYGGRGASMIEQVIYSQEAADYDVPDSVFGIGIQLGGPTVVAHGSEEQKTRWLPKLLSGEEIWCQLFSEPGAGSDLAGLRTRAVRDGDEWVLNGQKVWSSGAHYSKWGMLLARTDADAPKHKGISYFLLDMDRPGIEIRPLRQMTGASHFNEVFFTDVRVPDHDRIGDVNDGWRVAQTTLLNERAALGHLLSFGNVVDGLVEQARLAERAGRAGTDDARVRQELAAAFVEAQMLRFIGYRIVTAISKGVLPGPEASIVKLVLARLLNRAAAIAVGLGGPDALAGENDWTTLLLAAPSVRIAGGSDEVQRNIVGERVLGLPKEPPAFPPETPFRALPS